MAETLAASLRDSAGRPSAFSRVYEAKASVLLAFFVRRTYDVEVARDLTAETFAEAFAHRKRFRGRTDAEAAAWLFGIARHQLGRYARKGVVQRKALARLGVDVPSVTEDDHHRIVELAGLADVRKTVAEAFASLPQEQREALRLRVIDQHDYPEVASALGVSEQTARARVSRALRRISDLSDMRTPVEASP